MFFSTLGTNKIGIKYKGTVEIPNLSDENDMDDLDVSEPLSLFHACCMKI